MYILKSLRSSNSAHENEGKNKSVAFIIFFSVYFIHYIPRLLKTSYTSLVWGWFSHFEFHSSMSFVIIFFFFTWLLATICVQNRKKNLIISPFVLHRRNSNIEQNNNIWNDNSLFYYSTTEKFFFFSQLKMVVLCALFVFYLLMNSKFKKCIPKIYKNCFNLKYFVTLQKSSLSLRIN